MSTGINNDKHYTNNIFVIKLFFILVVLILFSFPLNGFSRNKEKGWVIVIDAGHGGKDPGAVGAVSYEKNIVLPIALKTGDYIKKNIKNATVIYTRDDDTFVELRDRANIANKNNADLFISIHANWAESQNVKGTETFIMGIAKDEANLEVAMKENEVILLESDYTTKYEGFDPKSPESYIIFTLMQNTFLEQSLSLATSIQLQFKNKLSRIDRGVKQGGLYVLFMTTMPSVLIETGFITNITEEKFLNSKEGQDYISSAIFRACRDYIAEIDSKSGISWGNEQISTPEVNPAADMINKTEEMIFKVQITASATKKEIKPENFNGLTDITELSADNRFKYASGSFTDYSEAVNHRKKLESIYPGAFVIAIKENKIVPLQQALDQIKNK